MCLVWQGSFGFAGGCWCRAGRCWRLAFYALNPNLLYLSTTAMTEPLFLALLIWIVLMTMLVHRRDPGGAASRVSRRMILARAAYLCRGIHSLRRMGTGRGGVVRGGMATLARAGFTASRSAQRSRPSHCLRSLGRCYGSCYNQHFHPRSAGLYARALLGPRNREERPRRRDPSTIADGTAWAGPCCFTRALRRWWRLPGRRALP